jgi:hypothetical protein
MTLAQAPTDLQAAVRTTLGGPTEQEELTPADSTGYTFGWSVDISGSTAVVGAPFCFHTSCPGGAYVFVRSGEVWIQQAKLVDPEGLEMDAFGQQLALSGSTLVVGVPAQNEGKGAVYVFVRSGGIWTQRATLTASDGVVGDQFGWSMAISGSLLVVGANGKDGFTGAAYVFVRSGGVWTQRAKLTASDGAPGDRFGWSVDLSGSTAVIGALHKDSDIGAAYVFVRSEGIWTQHAELAPSDGTAGDLFGFRVALSGPNLVVTTPYKDTDTGAAYVFANSGGVWSEQAKLTASDGSTQDDFGWSVDIFGPTVVVGAPFKDPQNAGAAYVFVNSGGVWSQLAKLVPSDATAYDEFGNDVGLYRSTAVIGAPGHGSQGAAYVFVNVEG